MPLLSRRAVSSARGYGMFNGGIPPIQYLVVAGGGGAAGWINGVQAGATGGAGGVLTDTSKLFKAGVTYTITIGNGGASSYGGSGTNGDNTTLIGTGISLTAIGGGLGGANGVNGGNGGSGGGGGGGALGGTATPGQGYNGGNGDPSVGGGYGGGAGGAGGNGGGGPIGIGIANPITGSTAGYTPGSGYYLAGSGGGANTGLYNQYGGGGNATNAYPNTGSGGGGGGVYPGGNININGAGASGVVVISYPKSWRAATTTGSPTVITTATNRIYQFTSSGTITF